MSCAGRPECIHIHFCNLYQHLYVVQVYTFSSVPS
jgi:hypothetical protein